MSEIIAIEGGHKLNGTVEISGAKNATVALIPAIILADSPVTIYGVPEISDVDALAVLLEELNCTVLRSHDSLIVDPSRMENVPLVSDAVDKLRASYYLMGALLGKCKKVVMKAPGGCFLGPRPIDLHIKGFEALGAKVEFVDGAHVITADRLVGAKIYLDFASVGATINILLAAVKAEGKTVIENAAKEPEIIDVVNLLTKMGAKIRGAGTDTITIEGVEHLKGCTHEIIPDRIEAGTFLIMAAAAGERVIIQNNRVHYEFVIKRNITIIQGDSASGKTTLVNMIRQAENLGESSGINVSCEVPCRVLEGVNWKIILENSRESIFFIDEENYFIKTEEFASAIRGSENYFVLITRENLYNLPYSVEEIYGLHVSGKYRDTRKIYQKMYQIYPKTARLPVRVQKIITEDSNSGYQFFENVCAERNITCESAGGKTKIPEMIGKAGTEETCIIADGAAIGAEMNLLSNKIEEKQNVHLYLPESFEWLILNSDLLQDKEVRKILENPEDYIDSTEFFSWEQYFTKLLIQKTEGTYLQYKKAKLNPSYLQDKNKNKILESIQGIQWKIKSLK